LYPVLIDENLATTAFARNHRRPTADWDRVDTTIGRVAAGPCRSLMRAKCARTRDGRFSALLLRPGVQTRSGSQDPRELREKEAASHGEGFFDPPEIACGDREVHFRCATAEDEPELERVVDHSPEWTAGGQFIGSTHSPAGGTLAAEAVPGTVVRLAELERMIARLARRAAWGGDRQRGTARIELDLGDLAGGVLLVHADPHGVEVELDLPSSESAALWEGRIRRRLEARGLVLRRFEVH